MTDVDFYGDAPLPDDPGEAEPAGPLDFAAIGRAAKVAKMVEKAESLFIGAGLDCFADAEQIARTLRGFSDTEWLDLQTAAGIQLSLPAHRRKAPSQRTRDMVVERFSKRVDVAQEDG